MAAYSYLSNVDILVCKLLDEPIGSKHTKSISEITAGFISEFCTLLGGDITLQRENTPGGKTYSKMMVKEKDVGNIFQQECFNKDSENGIKSHIFIVSG